MQIKTIVLNHSSAILSAYLSDDHERCGLRKSILIFPGGGYTHCSEHEGEPIALAYLAKGFQAFVLRYRTNDPFVWSEAMDDANNALELLHEHSGIWRLDKEKIALIGFSAGGHLAACLTTSGRLRPCATILCYPLIIASLAKLISPQIPGISEQVDAKTPPIFVFSTFGDHVVPIKNTLDLLTALNEQNVPFECHIFEWGHHGLSLAKKSSAEHHLPPSEERTQCWFALSVSWLETLYDSKFQHPITIQPNTIGALLESETDKQQLLSNFPMLHDPDIAQALSYLTWEAFLEKMSGIFPHH